MTTGILRDQKIWFDGYDISGIMNSVDVADEFDMKDATTFGQNTRTNKPGLRSPGIGGNGYFDATPYDKALFDALGAAGKVVSVGADAAEGSSVYFLNALLGEYSPSGQAGEMFGFSMAAVASGVMARGTIMENNTTIAASGNGTARQLGAISSTQKMYAALHVLNAGGTTPTLDLTIESDATNSFAGGETTRITLTQEIALGSQWKELSGPVTDTWWRATWSVGGAAPDFNFVVLLAIQ